MMINLFEFDCVDFHVMCTNKPALFACGGITEFMRAFVYVRACICVCVCVCACVCVCVSKSKSTL